MAATRPAPTVADVTRIAAMPNRVLRNLEITQCYAELAAAMRDRTDGAADWCTFATWASRQAGRTIRGEDLLEGFQQVLGQKVGFLAPFRALNRWLLRRGLFQPETTLGRLVAMIHTPFDAFERASDAVARGNLKVFAEIGREFARYLATVPSDARSDSTEFIAFAAGLEPGPPPDGQEYLREAFAHYQRQRQESDPATRAAWILLANLKIGLHEQTRLQPQIAEAVDAPFTTAEDLGERVVDLWIPHWKRWLEFLHRPLARAVGWFAKRVRKAGNEITQQVVTEAALVLTLPNAVLHLGSNLDAPVPAVFRGAAQPDLATFTKTYDPCTSDPGNCGADDWSNLLQRMHYIVHLFRAYAIEPSLLTPPFGADVVARFRAGVVPEGDL